VLRQNQRARIKSAAPDKLHSRFCCLRRRQLLNSLADLVSVTDKAAHMILLANLIIKSPNRQSAEAARSASGANDAKLCGGLRHRINGAAWCCASRLPSYPVAAGIPVLWRTVQKPRKAIKNLNAKLKEILLVLCFPLY
jgi:hypothetical protein